MTAVGQRQGSDWSNWSGIQTCRPSSFVQPKSTDDVVRAIGSAVAAGDRIRVVGNGHSFSPIALTDGLMISLSRMNRVLEVDRESGFVKVEAGISVFDLSRALDQHGLALPNLGDIDVQSIAGAVATGTHGTGAKLGNISQQIEAVEIVTAGGDLITIDGSDPDRLSAVRVSLGCLGVVTAVTLKCVPSFTLDRLDLPAPLDETLENFDQLAEAYDHFEFYAFPFTDRAYQKRIDRIDAPPKPRGKPATFLNEVVFENWALTAFVNAGKLFPRAIPRISRAAAKTFSTNHVTDKSYEVFSTVRNVRFNEMEYAFPREHLSEVFTRVFAIVKELKLPVTFPVEIRVVDADEASDLSTAASRKTVYMAVHNYRGMEFEPYFRAVEAIMDEYEGRPHWGKINWQTAEKLAPRYPRWQNFQNVRRELDPGGVFSNDYVNRVLGEVG